MKEVEILSHSRVRLSTGTLYGAIKRLLEQSWIERVEEEEGEGNGPVDGAQGGRVRKAYRLTHQGRRILEAEVTRMETLVAAARQSTAGAQA